MGVKDIVTKDYTKENVVFADAFNQYIYKGEQVINPENLRPLDTNLIGLPYGADLAVCRTGGGNCPYSPKSKKSRHFGRIREETGYKRILVRLLPK